MFEVSVDETFSAGHALRDYHGKCENPHGHNFKVRVTLRGERLDSTGLLYDFVHLKQILRGVIGEIDHRNLNDQAPFDQLNPSAENIAEYFFTEISANLKAAVPIRLREVKVWETDIQSATYRR